VLVGKNNEGKSVLDNFAVCLMQDKPKGDSLGLKATRKHKIFENVD
jgi:hypothetical protein